MVELHRLLLIERVDVGVAAIDKRAAFDDIGLVSGRSVAKGAGAGLETFLNVFSAYPLMNAARSIGRSFIRMPIA
jgi:hypothetical protein